MAAVAIPLMAAAPAYADDVDPMGNGWYPEGFPAFCESHPADCLPVRPRRFPSLKSYFELDAFLLQSKGSPERESLLRSIGSLIPETTNTDRT